VVYDKLNNLFSHIRNNKIEINNNPVTEMSTKIDFTTTMNTNMKNTTLNETIVESAVESFSKKKKRFFSELGIDSVDLIAIKKYKPDLGCLERRGEKLMKLNKNLENIEFLINN
jgi:hypothetical protein